MKSDVISISTAEDRTELVLDTAERVAAYQRLSHKGALHLRLLAEEMMSMIRAVTGSVNGEFWIETAGEKHELHLHVGAVMNEQRRQQLLSASSSGKNEAERGFMGKLRAFFEPAATLPFFYFASGDGEFAEAVWTLSVYQRELQQELQRNAPGAAESWDELEKSVVAHLADDVKVSIRGSDVEMTIIKEIA